MAFDWTEVEDDIIETITEYGQVGALRPASGADIPVKFVVSQYDQQERDGELIQFGDQKVYLSTEGLSEVPTARHRLVFASGSDHRIVAVERIAPAELVLVYILQVR
jgi:hypothetical protein